MSDLGKMTSCANFHIWELAGHVEWASVPCWDMEDIYKTQGVVMKVQLTKHVVRKLNDMSYGHEVNAF